MCSVLVLQHFKFRSDLKNISLELYRILSKNGYLIFIEQVSNEKDELKYQSIFKEAGFILVSIKTIRRGRSISSWIASHIKLKTINLLKILSIINELEILFPPLVKTYEEKIFVFRKVENV